MALTYGKIIGFFNEIHNNILKVKQILLSNSCKILNLPQ